MSQSEERDGDWTATIIEDYEEEHARLAAHLTKSFSCYIHEEITKDNAVRLAIEMLEQFEMFLP